MANKLPTFLIANNPMARPLDTYVYFTKPPRFLAKYQPESNDFVVVDEIDNFAEFYKDKPYKLDKIMRRLDDWFIAYKHFKKQQNNQWTKK